MVITRRIKMVFLFACGVIAAGLLTLNPASATEAPSYVGNAACARCHEAIARRYAETPMARSSGEVKADFAEATFTHQASGVRYRISSEGGATYLEYERAGEAAIKGKQQLHDF